MTGCRPPLPRGRTLVCRGTLTGSHGQAGLVRPESPSAPRQPAINVAPEALQRKCSVSRALSEMLADLTFQKQHLSKAREPRVTRIQYYESLGPSAAELIASATAGTSSAGACGTTNISDATAVDASVRNSSYSVDQSGSGGASDEPVINSSLAAGGGRMCNVGGVTEFVEPPSAGNECERGRVWMQGQVMTWVARPGTVRKEDDWRTLLPVEVRITEGSSHEHPLNSSPPLWVPSSRAMPPPAKSPPAPSAHSIIASPSQPRFVVAQPAPLLSTPPLQMFAATSPTPAPSGAILGLPPRERARETAVGNRCWEGAAPELEVETMVPRRKIAAPGATTSGSDSAGATGGTSGTRVRSNIRPSSSTGVRPRDERRPKRWRSLQCDVEDQRFTGGVAPEVMTHTAPARTTSLPPTPARSQTFARSPQVQSSSLVATVPPLRSRRRRPSLGQHVEVERSVPTITGYSIAHQAFNISPLADATLSDPDGDATRSDGSVIILATGPPRRPKEGRSRV